MSYKTQIKVYDDPEFYDNAVRFASADEAEAYGKNKLWNWTMAEKYRVVESSDPVNYRWDETKGTVRIID